MARRDIVFYPDPRLTTISTQVTVFDDTTRALAADLLDTMRAAPGIGITGAHIGVLARIVVLDLGDGMRIYVNPRITWVSPERIHHREGSISMPGASAEVERAARIGVDYQDLDAEQQTEEADGLRAVCLQHEIDQLDGIFWIQRLSRLKRERLVKAYEKSRTAHRS